MMVAGIPNSGNSFINRLARSKRQRLKTGRVTRGNQWFVTGAGPLLDTPVLWPKFDEEKVALHLAITGAIHDEVLNIEKSPASC